MAGSGRARGGAGDGPGPYFFLSYARHHRAGEAKGEDWAGDPDRWTLRFFDDLTYEVTELTTLGRDAQPGFMDREVRVGQEWQRRISEALAACRVFVPLYTPRYFTSKSCASEWYLFQARQSAHELTSGDRPEAIIPVLWLPIPDKELPAAARALQFDHHTFGEAYARLGFLQLIRLARYKDDYQMAIHALARHLVKVAHTGAPRAARPVDFTALHGRFETAAGLFEAAGELVRRAGGRAPLPMARGPERLALPPGTGELPSATDPPAPSSGATSAPPNASPSDESGSAEPSSLPRNPADEAVAAYLRTAHTKLAEWFTSRSAQASSVDFDDFYFREVHPAAKAAFLRQLTPHAAGPFPRPPRLRGGPPHAL